MKWLARLVSVLTVVSATSAFAAGYDTPMLYSASHMGMGGTAIGSVDDPSAIFHNPAGLSRSGVGALHLDVSPLGGVIQGSPDKDALSIKSNTAISPFFMAAGSYRVVDRVHVGFAAYLLGGAAGSYNYNIDKTKANGDLNRTSVVDSASLGFIEFAPAVSVRIIDGLNLCAGRKEFDTPFINRNDTRMTPNTFEAVVLQGRAELGENSGTLKYGLGYFDQIKERNSDDFVSMAVDAGAKVERGVFTAGALYQKGNFSLGAIDYYCADIINIGYVEAKLELPFGNDYKLRLAAQFADQRSVGDNLLTGEDFSARQFGLKAEVPVGKALFSAAYTGAIGNTNMQSPWSGYPGYTSVQVQDFNREGENAFLLRAGYELPCVDGLSAYALGVFGTTPDQSGQYRQDEYDLNLQWAPPTGCLKGLALRLRYALVEQHGGDVDNLTDFRVICNYTHTF